MRDSLVFTAERRSEHITAVCHGQDRQGRPVEFELDPAVLYENLKRQADWAAEVATAARILRRGINAGISPDTMWPVIAALMPADLAVDTGWSAGPVQFGADGSHQLVQGRHDALGDAVDRQR